MTIWADAICVNQRDVEERNQQLLRMGAIYRRAETTVAWLGEEGDETTDAIGLLQALSDRITALPLLNPFKLPAQSVPIQSAKITLSQIGPRRWKALVDLLSREYWRRIWITQEVALSQEVLVVCGSHSIHWSKFAAVFAATNQKNGTTYTVDPDIASTPEFQHACQLQQFRVDSMADKPVHFFDALFRTRASHASEVRDRVFAILGLSYNGSAFVAVPDYTQSVFDLCLEITMSAITYYRSLDVIVFLGNREDYEAGSTSSWMPNWLIALPTYERPYKYLTGEMQFRNGKTRQRHGLFGWKPDAIQVQPKWRASLDSKPIFNYDSSCLTVKGMVFDILTGLTSTYGGLAGSTSDTDTIKVRNPYKDDAPSNLIRLLPGISVPDTTVLNALFYLLTCLVKAEGVDSTSLDHVTEEYHDFLSCWPPSSYTGIGDEEPLYKRVWSWFHQNENFLILGKTLHDWKQLATQYAWPGKHMSVHRPEKADAILQWEMRLSVTKRGYLGWTVQKAMAGDRIAILLGCTVPAVLRPRTGGGWYVVGDAIFHGIMDGEAFARLPPVGEWGFLTLH